MWHVFSAAGGFFLPSALTEGETTNLRVRMDSTNISLCRPVRYSTEPAPQPTADNRPRVISLDFTENRPISEKSITGHCPAKTVCQTLIKKNKKNLYIASFTCNYRAGRCISTVATDLNREQTEEYRQTFRFNLSNSGRTHGGSVCTNSASKDTECQAKFRGKWL